MLKYCKKQLFGKRKVSAQGWHRDYKLAEMIVNYKHLLKKGGIHTAMDERRCCKTQWFDAPTQHGLPTNKAEIIVKHSRFVARRLVKYVTPESRRAEKLYISQGSGFWVHLRYVTPESSSAQNHCILQCSSFPNVFRTYNSRIESRENSLYFTMFQLREAFCGIWCQKCEVNKIILPREPHMWKFS